MINPKPGEAIIVVTEASNLASVSGWHNTETLNSTPSPDTVSTIGFVVRADERLLILAQSMSAQGTKVSNVIMINRGSIVDMQPLRKYVRRDELVPVAPSPKVTATIVRGVNADPASPSGDEPGIEDARE